MTMEVWFQCEGKGRFCFLTLLILSGGAMVKRWGTRVNFRYPVTDRVGLWFHPVVHDEVSII